MASTLPIQIEFGLPEGWLPAPPDEVGAPGVAFVALHPEPQGSFRANITISGELRTGEQTLASVADESLQRLKQGAAVQLEDRRRVGTPEAPGLTQILRLSTTIGGEPIELIQAQVYLGMVDVNDSSKAAVIELVLTATADQFQGVVEDFQRFVATVRPAEKEEPEAQA